MTDRPLLLFVGCATLDSIALVDEYPAADSRTIADELVVAGGGPSATAAVAAARLGARTAFAGVVGEDEDGDRVVESLVREGVDVSAVERSSARPTQASLVIVSRALSARTIVTRRVPAMQAAATPRLRELAGEASWVHADHLGWHAVAELRPHVRISVDAGNPIPGFSVDGVDLYVPTIERLGAENGSAATAGELVAAARSRGARDVVATAGSSGAWVLGEDTPLSHVPAVPDADIVSTLGAGDVFHGALLAAIAARQDLVTATGTASAVAAASCAAVDGRSAIPTWDLWNAPLNAVPAAPAHDPSPDRNREGAR